MEIGEIIEGQGRGAGPAARKAAAVRQAINLIVEEVRKFSKMSKVQRVFLLGQRAFVAWFIREEGMNRAEAEQTWKDDFGKQEDLHHR